MKPKLLLCLALVLSSSFCFCAGAQGVTSTNKWIGFPSYPPLTNVNPSVTHPVSVRKGVSPVSNSIFFPTFFCLIHGMDAALPPLTASTLYLVATPLRWQKNSAIVSP
jgi:hypothetical protein